MTKPSFSILDLARRGAMVRWNELQSELADLVKMFPSLRDVRTGGTTIPGERGAATTGSNGGVDSRGTRRRKMSPVARKAVSLRMKKYWAARRKEKGL
jgi:hypothetical protein